MDCAAGVRERSGMRADASEAAVLCLRDFLRTTSCLRCSSFSTASVTLDKHPLICCICCSVVLAKFRHMSFIACLDCADLDGAEQVFALDEDAGVVVLAEGRGGATIRCSTDFTICRTRCIVFLRSLCFTSSSWTPSNASDHSRAILVSSVVDEEVSQAAAAAIPPVDI